MSITARQDDDRAVREGSGGHRRVLFGPIPSRRLGISLGVDLIPHKNCTLDCLYCECGPTTHQSLTRQTFFPYDGIPEELDRFFAHPRHLDALTFSGYGEPTLSLHLGAVVQELKARSTVPVVVITNGTLLGDPQVQRELILADRVLPSLDAGSEEVYRRINRPLADMTLKGLVDGLARFRERYPGALWLEVFLAEGLNDDPEELKRIRAHIEAIRPDRIQLNTLDRPPAYPGVRPMPRRRLMEIVSDWGPERTEIIKRVDAPSDVPAYSESLHEHLLQTLGRRPLTLEDICRVTGQGQEAILTYLDLLMSQKRVRPRVVDDAIFYTVEQPE